MTEAMPYDFQVYVIQSNPTISTSFAGTPISRAWNPHVNPTTLRQLGYEEAT